jgi:hypothetical protein
MKTNNKFMPKRILPERFDFIVESFHMRELFEIESMEEFTHFINDLTDWATRPGHYVSDKDLKMEQITLFMIEIILRNRDERKLVLRHLTNFDLLDFLSRLDEELDWIEISEVMEFKGVP